MENNENVEVKMVTEDAMVVEATAEVRILRNLDGNSKLKRNFSLTSNKLMSINCLIMLCQSFQMTRKQKLK